MATVRACWKRRVESISWPISRRKAIAKVRALSIEDFKFLSSSRFRGERRSRGGRKRQIREGTLKCATFGAPARPLAVFKFYGANGGSAKENYSNCRFPRRNHLFLHYVKASRGRRRRRSRFPPCAQGAEQGPQRERDRSRCHEAGGSPTRTRPPRRSPRRRPRHGRRSARRRGRLG